MDTKDEPRPADSLRQLVGRFTEPNYLRFDPFEGDRDVDIRCHEVKMVTTRKPHRCAMPGGPDGEPHTIPPGARARFERAIVEGAWGSYHICTACMDKFLEEICGLTPNKDSATI